MTSRLSVSIVVPVLQEATTIEAALARLAHDFPDCELVVVDGGSTDGTAGIAGAAVPTLVSDRGRARQMNIGASATRGDVLWFVHADTVIDPAALAQLRAALAEPRVVGGGLSLRFDRRCTVARPAGPVLDDPRPVVCTRCSATRPCSCAVRCSTSSAGSQTCR